jgi:hypothetical protein
MQTGAAIVPSGSHNQHALLGTQLDRLSEQGLSLTGRGNFPSASNRSAKFKYTFLGLTVSEM